MKYKTFKYIIENNFHSEMSLEDSTNSSLEGLINKLTDLSVKIMELPEEQVSQVPWEKLVSQLEVLEYNLEKNGMVLTNKVPTNLMDDQEDSLRLIDMITQRIMSVANKPLKDPGIINKIFIALEEIQKLLP